VWGADARISPNPSSLCASWGAAGDSRCAQRILLPTCTERPPPPHHCPFPSLHYPWPHRRSMILGVVVTPFRGIPVNSTRRPCRLGGGDGDGCRPMRCWEAKWKEPMGGVAGSSPSPASVIPGAPHPHPDRGQLRAV
jgi:hypothetical protein